jgi:SAM-dependent methyltransferase
MPTKNTRVRLLGRGEDSVTFDDYGRVQARYFDAHYAVRRDPVGDGPFYLELAREQRGPVLELGCGTGRLLLPIAREGFPCTGLDPSPEMLKVLRAKNPPETLRLVPGRMEDLDLGDDRFTLIFSGFRSLQHLYSVEDQLSCLVRVRKHLAPGGLFAFDVFAPKFDRLSVVERPETEEARFELDGEEVVLSSHVRNDSARQLLQVEFRYERSRDGEIVGEDRVRFPMRYYFRYELEHLLQRAGFDDLTLYGDFDRRPYDYLSGETVVLAR